MRRAILVALALLILVPAIFLAWLMNTEGGLRWAYRSLLPSLPAELRVAELSGVLGGPLILKEVSYQDQGQAVSAGQVELDWNPWALLRAEIDVTSLRIHSVEVVISDSPTAADAAPTRNGLPAVVLPLALGIDNASIDDIEIRRGENSYRLNKVRLELRAASNKIDIGALDIDTESIDASVSGEIRPDGDYPHDLRFSWQTSLPSGAALSGAGQLSGDLAATRLTQQTRGAVTLTQALEIQNLLGAPGWQSKVDIAAFDAASIDPGLPALEGSLQVTASGDLNSARVTGSMRGVTPRLGSFDANFVLDSLAGERSFDGMRIETLRVSALQGELTASGQLDWSPALHWEAAISTAGINPVSLFPDWPGQIDARLSTAGGIDNDELFGSARIGDFQGNLRGYPVSAQGELKWRDQGIDIGRLDFTSGETRVSARGRVAAALDLTWSLDSSNLAEIYPDAQGNLSANGSLGGTRVAPRIRATLSGTSLSLPGYRLGKVDGKVDLNPFELRQFDIQLAAKGVVIQEQQIQALELSADDGRIKASMIAANASAQVELAGKAEGESWRGKLVRAAIQTPAYSDWDLAAPAAVHLSRDAISVARLCLRDTRNSEVCGSIQGRQPDWKIDLDVNRLPLQMLGRWTPAEVSAEGLANASARLDYRHPDGLLGNIDIELTQGSVSHQLQPQKPLRLDYRTGSFAMQLSAAGVQAKTLVTLVNGDRLEGTANLPGANLLAFNPDTQELQGEVGIGLRDLGIVDAMIDEIDQLHGDADIAIALGGSVGKPRLTGKVSLSDAGLRIPRLNLVLRQLSIDANSDSSANMNYRARARVGDGGLEIRGNTLLDAASGWPSEVAIDSEGVDLSGLLNSWLPPEVDLDGLFDTTARLQYRAPDQLQGEAEITSKNGNLRYPLLEGEIEKLEYRDVRLDLVINDGIRATGAALVGSDSRLNATLYLPTARLLALDVETQAIVGNAQLNFRELAIIEALVPEIDRTRGDIIVSLDVAGSLAQPRIRGGAEIIDASVSIPRIGLNIDRITLQGTTDDADRFNFVLSARSGGGQLNVEGSSLLDVTSGWPTRISIKGENFEASRIPEAVVNVSPDLTVQLSNRTIDIQGKLLIPYAKLQPRDFTSAARVSSDTVIVGGAKIPDPKWTITSRVNLILGDRVSFFGYGFEGRLAGKLLITEEPGQ
ncbi:MAG: translocation/assembly module TamB domain-containing protein, partial [Gammaproteobacteria bacterium]|nr:translocation/assembly module TamB domain-containing protein [Gammaproteobacteria bacterium]